MLTNQPTMHDLFDQIGLDSDEESLEAYLIEHHLEPDEALEDAKFLSEQQIQALTEMRDDDAEWSELIDELDSYLHQ